MAAPALSQASSAYQSPNVKTLAGALVSANTVSGKVSQLMQIARAVGIGVYTGHGRPLVRGTEAGPRSFYLYEAEITALADQLKRKQLVSYNTIAQALTRGHVPTTGAKLKSVVVESLNAVPAQATTPVQAQGQLFDALGTARGADPEKIAPGAAELDSLQATLLLGDLALAAQRKAAQSGAAADTPALPSSVCDSNFNGRFKATIPWLKTVALAGAAFPVGLAISALIDSPAALLIAYSTAVVPYNTDTHLTQFGTHGPDSGQPIDFKVEAEMRDKLPDLVIDCGSIAGYTIPHKGPISGVPIEWQYAINHLQWLGTVTCAASCHTTNADGIATLHFQPDDEYLPGEGQRITEIGVLQAIGSPQGAANNPTGQFWEVFGVGKLATVGWGVSYHDPGGYEITIPTLSFADAFHGVPSWTDTWKNEQACLGVVGIPHPLKPKGVDGRTPEIGYNSSFTETTYLPKVPPITLTDNLGTFPMDFTLPAETANFGEVGWEIHIHGQWVFTSPKMTATVDLTRDRATPASKTLHLAVSPPSSCPALRRVGGNPGTGSL